MFFQSYQNMDYATFLSLLCHILCKICPLKILIKKEHPVSFRKLTLEFLQLCNSYIFCVFAFIFQKTGLTDACRKIFKQIIVEVF